MHPIPPRSMVFSLGPNLVYPGTLKSKLLIFSLPLSTVLSLTLSWGLSAYIIFAELGLTICQPIQVLCDNISVIYIAANLVLHDHSKHNKVDYHFFHEFISHGDLFVPAQLQLENIFTKNLPRNLFYF